MMTTIALTIAGSDSAGGAGIQADLRTFAALGVHGASAITALTAQNTLGVEAVHTAPPEFVLAEMRAIASDLDVGAIKTGMLGNLGIVEAVVEGLSLFPGVPVVVDPVMVSQSGHPLLTDEAIDAIRTKLMPRAILVTPNMLEAARLLGEPVARDEAEMAAQAQRLREQGASAVLVKGGHGSGPLSVDILADTQGTLRLEAPRTKTQNTHGTGCTLSAATAAELAKGAPLREALAKAKAYVTAAIAAADELKIGKGRGPVHHFHAVWPRSDRRRERGTSD
jgi:hydroxymethylpyrimidine/phosphomethylpyrimidine kinase